MVWIFLEAFTRKPGPQFFVKSYEGMPAVNVLTIRSKKIGGHLYICHEISDRIITGSQSDTCWKDGAE